MKVTDSPPRSASVVAAFLLFGLRKAGTPLLIASTPVSAAQPDAKARSTRNAPARPMSPCSKPSSGSTSSTALSAMGSDPVAKRTNPTTAMDPTPSMNRYVGIAKRVPDSLTPRRLSSVSSTTSPMANDTSWPRSAGSAVAAYWAPEEIDTATVST